MIKSFNFGRFSISLTFIGVQMQEKEFYIPHIAFVCEKAESTKLGFVYNVSARPNNNAHSLTLPNILMEQLQI